MKSLFLSIIGLASFIATAQMSLKKLDGTPINDGDVFTFDTAEEPGSYMGIKIFNNSDNDINIKVKVLSIENSTGTNLQLCVGNVCLSTITAGSSYPNFPAVIEANGQNGDFDHFLNLNSGINPALPVEYGLKFFQVDENGVETGNSVSFTYRFVSALGVSDFNNLAQTGVTLKSNVVASEIEMDLAKNVQYDLYDVSGKSILHQNATTGEHRVDVSNLNAGVYILYFQNDLGQKSSARIIKK
ncbi:T9SS type A sorting domain-containing protein [Flavobacterium sp. CYK-4]|uniref:T9SS type A sorting domain-containing protein n=1 Tax=Flavobacterium lotistagni TaxID=2709660 RepID=UPI00140727B9|nr:T9SS type A sorting domain-containing protein [Flavobacterium lotistagni]NHM05948.1 T9SS type A sorting domain-containing protein [Flavobacterium lotistagni]